MTPSPKESLFKMVRISPVVRNYYIIDQIVLEGVTDFLSSTLAGRALFP